MPWYISKFCGCRRLAKGQRIGSPRSSLNVPSIYVFFCLPIESGNRVQFWVWNQYSILVQYPRLGPLGDIELLQHDFRQKNPKPSGHHRSTWPFYWRRSSNSWGRIDMSIIFHQALFDSGMLRVYQSIDGKQILRQFPSKVELFDAFESRRSRWVPRSWKWEQVASNWFSIWLVCVYIIYVRAC